MPRRASLLPALFLLVFGPATACEPAPDADALRAAYWPEAQIRPEVSGIHGAVTAGHPLAAQAGYEVLRAGGNAADAAVTMAAVLAVVRPHMNGVGGDAFALFYEAETGRVRALNGSGRAAAAATPGFFADRGHDSMPQTGPLAVTVPGAVSAWASTLQRYGTISMAQALAPAIRLAEEGFVVTHTLAEDLADALGMNEAGRNLYAPEGTPLPAGSVLRNPALARTLRALANQGSAALYGGEVSRALARFLEAEGSPLRLEDFAAHASDWVEPIATEFRGKRVHTLPPNSQSIALLQTLAMAEASGLDDYQGPLDPDLLHTLVEAKKLAFADRDRWVADPEAAPAPLERLLDRDYLAERAGQIGPRAAEAVGPGFDGSEGGGAGTALDPPSGPAPTASTDGTSSSGDGDTVYLIAVDAQGNVVSWIQSLFHSFGSGLLDPETGIVLQNRGGGFTLEEGHPNRIAPGKRPFHTLMATLVTNRDGSFHMALGTPGGHGQSQTLVQALVQMLVFGLSPQAAVEAPRFRSYDGLSLAVEGRLSEATIAGFAARGHDLTIAHGWTAPYGNLQVIRREENGVLRTGADMRREGAAAAY
jgi:gamma-glutamyltranspeptidase / glutathione hydrolase